MKATTIATKYPTLSKVADLLTSCRPVILYDLYDLLSIGYVRPQREAGHGRWSHIEDHRVEIQEALDACSIAVVKFNDAPRTHWGHLGPQGGNGRPSPWTTARPGTTPWAKATPRRRRPSTSIHRYPWSTTSRPRPPRCP